MQAQRDGEYDSDSYILGFQIEKERFNICLYYDILAIIFNIYAKLINDIKYYMIPLFT
jgi:hypothetical protein